MSAPVLSVALKDCRVSSVVRLVHQAGHDGAVACFVGDDEGVERVDVAGAVADAVRPADRGRSSGRRNWPPQPASATTAEAANAARTARRRPERRPPDVGRTDVPALPRMPTIGSPPHHVRRQHASIEPPLGGARQSLAKRARRRATWTSTCMSSTFCQPSILALTWDNATQGPEFPWYPGHLERGS